MEPSCQTIKVGDPLGFQRLAYAVPHNVVSTQEAPNKIHRLTYTRKKFQSIEHLREIQN